MNQDFTVVTNCNRNYLWGAFLLAASLRYQKNPVPVHVLVQGFTAQDNRLLEQFGNVRVIEADKTNPRNFANLKAEALLTADTNYIGWFDSDCMVVGDITPYWKPPNDSFQARFRTPEQMVDVYRTKYASGEKQGSVPKRILDTWRADVGENQTPAVQATCTTDNFVIHRRHLNFIKRWDEQLKKVIPAEDQGVVNPNSFAYRQTDEEVINSLLIFSRHAPPIDGQYLLDKDPNAFVLHLGMTPKPWQGWQHRHIQYYDRVVSVVEWVQEKGYKTPLMPMSLQRKYRPLSQLQAMKDGAYDFSKGIARRVLKR
ncbi:MAG: hypothetical protein JWQ71_4651 [Pedosphaera sp.]|nr:hypothetical protein [Pedosphaera sp.]